METDGYRRPFMELSLAGKFVDQSFFIRDILTYPDKVFLFTRPHNSGKSVNMDMLETFLEKKDEDNSRYFGDLSIWKEKELIKANMGKYPVAVFPLGDIEYDTWTSFIYSFSRLVSREYSRHPELENSNKLMNVDKTFYHKAVAMELDERSLCYAMRNISQMLYLHYSSKCFVIIEDYDAFLSLPLDASSREKLMAFLERALGNVLKTNEALEKGIVTGVFSCHMERVNNIREYSLLNSSFQKYFSSYEDKWDISESELSVIEGLLDNPGVMEKMAELLEGKSLIDFVSNRYPVKASVYGFSDLCYVLMALGLLKVEDMRTLTNDTRKLCHIRMVNEDAISFLKTKLLIS